MKTGIYTITNLVNNKIYLGLSLGVEKRIEEHRTALKEGVHKNIHLQEAWNKYGEENFSFELLLECSSDLLASEEHYWCSLLNVHDRRFGYNIRPTHPLGKVINTEEIRTKISSSKKGTKLSEESIRKRTETRLKNAKERGFYHSKETKAKMGENSGFRKITEEQRKVYSEKAITASKSRVIPKEEIVTRVNSRKNNGLPWHSEETLRKMSKPKTKRNGS